ncbi:MAG: NAD(P)H-dependent flavin oxidoreductase [Dermatophilaceae bacterium]
MTSLLGSPLPLVAAPMAGGATTPELAVAVAGAGAFPFLAGGYLTPQALRDQIDRVRGRVTRFGVNLFVPDHRAPDPAAFRRYADELAPEARRHGIQLDREPVTDDDAWPAKLALLVRDPVPVVSLTFALPSRQDVAALQRAGSQVLATVTSATEAVAARGAGVDGLVVQGSAAGGHRGCHDPAAVPRAVPTAELVREVRSAVDLPVVAAGGVDGAGSVRQLREAGAEAVAVGTLLLRTDEAGTSRTHRDALADPAFTETVVTRAFTGRPARALRNRFVDAHDATAPVGYPAVHHLTRELRRHAAHAGDAETLHLWAGTGYRHAATGPAADVIRRLS